MSCEAWYGHRHEDSKVITHRASVRRAVKKCSVHFVPIAATVVLAGLNIGEYFIGSEYKGPDSGRWQDFDKLSLQLAAKLYELVSVASLSTILMDIIRWQLLWSSNGLPLGILAAKTLFVDTAFLLSPEFRFGISSIDTRIKRYLLAALIVVCSILALLIGPSSALLLIPQAYSDWNAGGATFSLNGRKESIWPSYLDAQATGGDLCQSPTERTLSLQHLNMSSCVWSGYAPLLQWWQSTHLTGNLAEIPVQDGEIQRSMRLKFYGSPSAAVFGISLAPCSYAQLLQYIWWNAGSRASGANPNALTRTANIRYRAYGTTISMNSQIPVVRTSCLTTLTNDSVVYASLGNKISYPLQPEYPLDFVKAMDNGHYYEPGSEQYTFDAPTTTNSSRIAAIWLETPLNQSIGTKLIGGNIVGRSSAYLNVQIPLNETAGRFAACSIDARWVHSKILGSHIAEETIQFDASYQAPNIQLDDVTIFPALDDGNWTPVRLGIDWLSALTPAIANSTSYWNTLSSILTSAGLLNDTGLLTNVAFRLNSTVDITANAIAAIVSSIVVDGMSRSGYEANGGLVNDTSIPYKEDPEAWSSVLAGTYVLPFDFGNNDVNETNKFQMQWSVAVTGLGYRLNSIAYILALAVLFFHVFLAIGHIIWVLWTREVSSAWSSLTDMLVLAFKSTPPESTLSNTAVGVERFRTFGEPLYIRASSDIDLAQTGSITLQKDNANSSQVEIITGSDCALFREQHKRVVIGQEY